MTTYQDDAVASKTIGEKTQRILHQIEITSLFTIVDDILASAAGRGN